MPGAQPNGLHPILYDGVVPQRSSRVLRRGYPVFDGHDRCGENWGRGGKPGTAPVGAAAINAIRDVSKVAPLEGPWKLGPPPGITKGR
jgi:hypothetical protein